MTDSATYSLGMRIVFSLFTPRPLKRVVQRKICEERQPYGFSNLTANLLRRCIQGRAPSLLRLALQSLHRSVDRPAGR